MKGAPREPVRIIALDLGTKCGWAYIDRYGAITSGTWDFKPRRHEGGGMRWVRFRQLVNQLIDSSTLPCMIVYEEVRRHLGTDAAQIYGGFVACVEEIGDARGVPYQGIPVATLKKHATGKGNAKKVDMILAAEQMGWFPKDDNEADALWLLDYAVQMFDLGAGQVGDAHEPVD